MRLVLMAFTTYVLLGAPEEEKPLAFGAASVKTHRDELTSGAKTVAKVGGGSALGGSLLFRPGMVVSGRRGITVRGIILEAYHLSSAQVSGGPAWLASDTFDIEGKAENASEAQLRMMLQALLSERFHLGVHRRKVNLAIYTLEAPRSGTKLREWKEWDPALMPTESYAMNYRFAGTLQNLADMLSADPRVGRPVLDKSDLNGRYIFSFGWDSDTEFLSSLQAQLGLTIKAGKAPMDVLVIDHVEKPTPN
jgi:uncharacterized protein (TIGR03435 family)